MLTRLFDQSSQVRGAPAPGLEPGTLRLTGDRLPIRRYPSSSITAGQGMFVDSCDYGRTALDDAWMQPPLHHGRTAAQPRKATTIR